MEKSGQQATEVAESKGVEAGPAQIVDYGVAPLEILPEVPGQALEITDFAGPEPKTGRPARGILRRICGSVWSFGIWLVRSLFGIASLILMLAVIAAIPVVNLLALGYLLEVEGRLARSGKFRDAFPLIDLAPRLGSIVLGLVAFLFPLMFLTQAAAEAQLIDPGSRADIALHVVLRVAAVAVAIHLCLALARGGGLSCFFRPIKNVRWLMRRWREGDYWERASAGVHDFLAGLTLKHHFLLGLKGYIGAMVWLAFPTLLFAATTKTEGGPILVTLLGGVLLMVVLSWVPFLQANLAAQDRLGAAFEIKKVWRLFTNAPFLWLFTMLITLALALPMYLFKIVLPPSDAMWLETIVFIVSIYPVKVLTGWVFHRAELRSHRQMTGFRRLFCRVFLPLCSMGLFVPLMAFYVFLLFFTQFIGEHGKLVLFEHHAFLLPAPFQFSRM